MSSESSNAISSLSLNARAVGGKVSGVRHERVLKSFFGGGFECSTHIRRSGRRLDLVGATKHDHFAVADYRRLKEQGLNVAREGVRWHLVEARPGHYDFSSVLPIVAAARNTETQVIWDLCHFGWPEHLDIFKPEFVESLTNFGSAFANWLANEMEEPGYFVPVNEISFISWAAGDEGSMFPFVRRRGFELKAQLVRATIETIKAIRAEHPSARFVQIDPIIHVVADPKHPEEEEAAEDYRQSQFQAWDMLTGNMCPELGGSEDFLDVIGVNFYRHNQWYYNLKDFRRVRQFRSVLRTNLLYRPLREMLKEVSQRYRQPVFIAETGAEGRLRRGWFRYVCEETRSAMQAGTAIQGICLYPIANHPGWVDDRHCENGLWDYPDENGNREIYEPLAAELRQWRQIFEKNNINNHHEHKEPACCNGTIAEYRRI
jgi:beta-glucosidase/6-phospho-beta-glucosidase/beta-galactosidase